MGGKKKHQSRGNTRPSSSRHSAELLSSSTSSDIPPRVSGFQNYPRETLGMKNSNPCGQEEENTNGAVRVITKMMLKKDVVTKLKGIREFIEYCSAGHENAMMMLPIFPRIYNKLALDPQLRIREAIQKALEVYAPMLKKDLVPYLKNFMPVWLITQCDPCTSAAFAAKSAFSQVFAEHKQSDAVIYCKSEILKLIRDNICELTEASVLESGGLSEDASKEKYKLILICSVRGFQLFVTILAPSDRAKVAETLHAIISENAFWNHSQSKIYQVRQAWYELVCHLVSEMPDVFEHRKRELVSVSTKSLWGTDSTVIGAIWNCAIQLFHSFPEWWSELDISSSMLPSLLKFLLAGGHGNASIVYPLLQHLFKEIVRLPAIGLPFCMDFFSSIRKSFFHQRVRVKKFSEECDAIVTGFMECFSYLTTIYMKDSNDVTSVKGLLTTQLFPLIKSSLEPEGRHLATSSFYPLLGLYLQNLEDHVANKEDNPSDYSDILVLSWETLSNEITGFMKMKLQKDDKDVRALVFLFHCLYQPRKYLSANERKINFYGERKVQFCGENSTAVETGFSAVTSPCVLPLTKKCIPCVTSFLFKYTTMICGDLCRELQSGLQPYYLELCAEIMCETSSSELFYDLLGNLNMPNSPSDMAPVIFFKTLLMDWVKRACACSDEVSLDWIGDIAICICLCVHRTSALQLLEVCSVVEHRKVFERLVIRIFESKERNDLFLQWFHSPTFALALKAATITFIRNLVDLKFSLKSHQTALSHKALMMCYTAAGSKYPEIPRLSITGILRFFTEILGNERYLNCENQGDYNVIDFLCDATAKLLHEHSSLRLKNPETLHFVFKVFSVSLDWAKFNISERSKEQKQLVDVWTMCCGDTVQTQKDLNEDNFLVMSANHLHNLLLLPETKDKHTYVVDVILRFLKVIEDTYSELPVDSCESLLILLVKKIFPSFSEWEALRNGLQLSTVAPILNGNWFYPYVPDERLPVGHIFVPPLIAVSNMIANILDRVWEDIIVNCKEGVQTAFSRILCTEHLPHVLWSVCYADSVNFFKAQDVPEPPVFSTLKKSFSSLLKKCGSYEVLKTVSILLVEDDVTWGIPFETLIDPSFVQTSPDHLISFCFAFDKYRKNYLSVIQIFLKYARKEFILDFLGRMKPEDFDSSTPRKEFCGNLSLLACCIQEHGLQFMLHGQEKILDIFERLVENWKNYRLCTEGDGCEALFVVGFSTVARGIVRDIPNSLSSDQWYSLIAIAVDWFKWCLGNADQTLTDSSSLIFAQQTCKLISTLCNAFQKKNENGVANYFNFEANAKWQEVFDAEISKQLVKFYLQMAVKVSKLVRTSNALDTVLIALSEVVEYLSAEQVFEALLPSEAKPKASFDASPDAVYKQLHELIHYMNSRNHCVQFGIHLILKKLIVHLPKIDQSSSDADSEELFRSFPLVKLVADSNEIVELFLPDVKSTECCILQPHTNPYRFALVHLLSWHLLLEYFSASLTEERSVYVGNLSDSQMLSSLLMVVIHLRPENPSACSGHIPRKNGENAEVKVDLHELPPINSLASPSYKHLQHVACCVYVSALKKIPALVRTMWSNLDKKAADILEKFTSENISKVLTSNEISTIGAYKDQFGNMAVDAYLCSRNVVASYTVDNTTIELSIKFPQNYPLGSVDAHTEKNVIVDQNRWRTWKFQLTTFLNYHNGSVKDALILWKKNLDKHFEGVEECMICYFIFHSSCGTLPTKSCRTCKKKFHASCLFTWFKTSNSCSCPGCRSVF